MIAAPTMRYKLWKVQRTNLNRGKDTRNIRRCIPWDSFLPTPDLSSSNLGNRGSVDGRALSGVVAKKKNYNSKREDKKEEDQPEDERNVIL